MARIVGIERILDFSEKALESLARLGKLKPANGVSFELAWEEFEKAKKNFSEGNLPGAKIQLSTTQFLLQESLVIF